MIILGLLIAAFVLFVLAAVFVPQYQRLVAAGLACWVLSVILGSGHV